MSLLQMETMKKFMWYIMDEKCLLK
jgi:hypothetical protein